MPVMLSRFAVRIEEDGEAFYRKAALAAQDKDIRGFVQFSCR